MELQRAIECRGRALLGTRSPRVNAERHRSCPRASRLAPQVAHGTQEAVPRVQHGYGTLWLRVNTGSCPEYGTALYGGATSQRRSAPELPRAERPAVRHVGEGLVALLRVIGVWQHAGPMPRVEALGRRRGRLARSDTRPRETFRRTSQGLQGGALLSSLTGENGSLARSGTTQVQVSCWWTVGLLAAAIDRQEGRKRGGPFHCPSMLPSSIHIMALQTGRADGAGEHGRGAKQRGLASVRLGGWLRVPCALLQVFVRCLLAGARRRAGGDGDDGSPLCVRPPRHPSFLQP